MIRVLLADDHPVVRSGLAALLADEPGLTIVGEAADGAEAVALADRTAPDVVLMDLRMPRMDGVEATARLTAHSKGVPAPRVLVLTTYESDDQIVAAIEAGAAGYLLKAAPHEEIVAAIHAVAAGQSALSPQVAARLVARTRTAPGLSALSPRETAVLRLVAQGRGNKQIAAELGIAESTVKTHLLNIFGKLEVSDRTRAATLAIERGLL